MAAILEKNQSTGKPVSLPDGMQNSEVLKCEKDSCHASYTMAWGIGEHRIQAGQNVIDVMRHKARKLIADTHSAHSVDTYIWGGIEKGWLDRQQAKAAGL